MIRHDMDQWPLVVSIFHGAAALEDSLEFLAQWTCWLDRGEPFATLRIFADGAAHARPKGNGREFKDWLTANGERMPHLVKGMASVVLPEYYEEMSRMDASRLFGVPARLFTDAGSALDWLAEHIVLPQPLRLDRLAVLGASVSRNVAIRLNASQISQHDDNDSTQTSAHQTR